MITFFQHIRNSGYTQCVNYHKNCAKMRNANTVYVMPGLHSHRDSMRQDENESAKGTFTLRLVFHTLDLFSSHLEALGDILVNQSQVKENENVLNV